MKRTILSLALSIPLLVQAAETTTDLPADLVNAVNGTAVPRSSIQSTGSLVKGVAKFMSDTRWTSADNKAKKYFIQGLGELLEILDKSDFQQLARDFGYEVYSGENTSREFNIRGFFNESNPPTPNKAVSRLFNLMGDPIDATTKQLDKILNLSDFTGSVKLDITILGVDLLASLAEVEIYIDKGDVMMTRGLLKAVKGALYLLCGYDFALDYSTLREACDKLAADIDSGTDTITAFDDSVFAHLAVSSRTDLQTALSLLRAAKADLDAGDALLKSRNDTLNHLFPNSSDDGLGAIMQSIASYSDAVLQCLEQLISPTSLASATVAVKSLELPYTGKAQSPVIGSATLGGITLPYDLTGTLCASDVGTYQVTLVGYGRSTGSQTLVWKIVAPGVSDDAGAKIRLDDAGGYVLTPSADTTERVVVNIPSGFDAANVTVEVSPEVKQVKLNGAKLRIVRGTADIACYLDIPAADANGIIDLEQATVKTDVVREILDTTKDATIDLNAQMPSITTAKTKPGLVYTLTEGTTLDGMNAGASKIGDGTNWTPPLTVRGGTSGFYAIRVTK